MSLYQRRIAEKDCDGEDFFLVGVMHQRSGKLEAAARAWKKVLEADKVSPQVLEEIGRICVQRNRWDEAIVATERLRKQPGYEARGAVMLGTIRVELNDPAAAAELFKEAFETDPAVVDKSQDPLGIRKLIARTFLRIKSPDQARPLLMAVLDRQADAEAAWLLSRACLQQGDKTAAAAALKDAGSYRAEHPLEPEPGPYIGEARCEGCHSKIFRDSLASRHTRTYYRTAQLDKIPLPGRSLEDPDDPRVSHSFRWNEGALHEETRVGRQVFDAVVEYAFGTGDRYVTMVSRDSRGAYHMSRKSYYRSSEGEGWDRSTLEMTHPTTEHPAEFQGQTIGLRDGLLRCLYCHVTNPKMRDAPPGPETADRAIGCERCHGPGGNHIAALDAKLADFAIVNPAGASPQAATIRQCNDCHILQRTFDETDAENPGWVRSQGVGWARSRCNTESGGSFGCVSCHDPHRAAHTTSTVEYESKCLACHGSPGHAISKEPVDSLARAGSDRRVRVCPVNPTNGCIGCHMPSIRIDSLHTYLTDHFIHIPVKKR